MITTFIIGNEILENERIASSLIGGTEMTTCTISTISAKEGLEIIHDRNYDIDLFIIGVKLKGYSGFRLCEKIRQIERYKLTPIVFVTSSSYSLLGLSPLNTYQSYKNYSYITLPIRRTDVQGKLGLYLEKIVSNQKKRKNATRMFYLKHKNGEIFLNIEDIIFAEVQGKVCNLYTQKGCFQIFRKSLTEIISMVDSDNFIKCHRCFALNINHLQRIDKLEKRLWNAIFEHFDQQCPISKTYLEEIIERYQKKPSIPSN